MTVVGHAGSVADSIARAAELKPDLVLIDFRLTDGTGADAATGIRQLRPEAKLIFLTREDSDAARSAALEAGASAFIHKSPAARAGPGRVALPHSWGSTRRSWGWGRAALQPLRPFGPPPHEWGGVTTLR